MLCPNLTAQISAAPVESCQTRDSLLLVRFNSN